MKLTILNKVPAAAAIIIGVSICAGALTHFYPGYYSAKLCVLSDDAKRGRAWANTCKSCHDVAAHQPSHPQGGPNLQDVYMSLAGTRPLPPGRENYPPLVAARDAGVVWTDDNLLQYLRNPKDFLERATGKSFDPAYYMAFFIGEGGARQDVIAYLKAIKDHPECD